MRQAPAPVNMSTLIHNFERLSSVLGELISKEPRFKLDTTWMEMQAWGDILSDISDIERTGNLNRWAHPQSSLN